MTDQERQEIEQIQEQLRNLDIRRHENWRKQRELQAEIGDIDYQCEKMKERIEDIIYTPIYAAAFAKEGPK